MLIHSWKVAGTEKFTTRHERYFPIPHSWLSSCGEIKMPHERRSLLSHSWENINVPFMIHWEFLIPPFAASRLMEELSNPNFLK